ncbi:MAG TPA: ABC transporter permease, partial [Gammaproteobacteria bacterium]|nr:ABC transporter permease [Gammaproteobacteria bacterium]
MNFLLQDLRYAVHQLRRSPSFTAVAVLTLALGIGANTAIFSVVNRLLLNPLPFAHADRIVYVTLEAGKTLSRLPVPDYMAGEWQAHARTVDGVEAFATRDLLAADDRGARLVHGTSISPGLTAFLGVQAVLGRGFTADDAKPGAPGVVLLSYGTWRREYGGAKDVLGRSIKLGDTLHTIIGVMPPRLSAIDAADQAADIWLPLDLHPEPQPADGAGRSYNLNVVSVVARPRPDVPLEQVRSELGGLALRAQETMGGGKLIFGLSGITTRITSPSQTQFRSNKRDALLVMLAAVGLVLLVACANVANLLLARGAARTREISLRAALGAGRWRLVRQLMIENLVLALAAGVAGAALGWGTLHVLMRLNPGNFSALRNVALDPFMLLAFTFALALATGLLFGLVPTLQLASTELGHALRHGGSGVVRGGGGARLRAALVAAEMAVSVILLVGAALLVRSVVYLHHVDVGFDTHNLFSVQLSRPRSRYQDAKDSKASARLRYAFAQQVIDGTRRIPGVAAVTQVFYAPPQAVATRGLEIRDRTLAEADASAGYPFNYVQPDYFRTLGIRLLSGRVFSAAEIQSDADHVVMINRTLAQRLWPGGGAVGRQLRTGTGGKSPWSTVIGVVDDALTAGGLTIGRHKPLIYWPYREENV